MSMSQSMFLQNELDRPIVGDDDMAVDIHVKGSNAYALTVSVPKRPKTSCLTDHIRVPSDIRILPSLTGKQNERPYYADYYSKLETLRIPLQPTARKTSHAAVVAVETTLFNQNSIQCVDFYERGVGPGVGEALGQLFDFKREHGVKHNIQVVILDKNPKIGPKGTIPIFKALGLDLIVTTLHFEEVGMGNQGAAALGSALMANKTLTHVNIASNHIDAEGITALSEALPINNTLTFLGVAFNKFRDEGVKPLCEALKLNDGLLSLELLGCALTDEGLVHVGLMLSKHQRLLELNVMHNHTTDDGLEAFGDLLERNYGLVKLNFTKSDHVSSVRLHNLIKRNRRLKQESEPKRLEQVIVRLSHQQYKLQQAQQALKEHQKVNVELEEAALKAEIEFNNNKQDLLRRSKDIQTNIGYAETNVKDLQRKRETMETDFEKLQKEHEENLVTLAQKLDEVRANAEKSEAEFQEVNKTMDELKRGLEEKREDYSKRIEQAREEAQTYMQELKAAMERGKEMQEQITLLQEQVNAESQKKLNALTAALGDGGKAGKSDESKKKGKKK